MKTKLLLICVASLTALLYGCGLSQRAAAQTNPNDQELQSKTEAGHVSHGVTFKEGEGLTIPDTTRDLLGLRIVDVEEGKATRRIELALRVFDRKASNGESFVLGSGSVTTNQASFLETGTEVNISMPSGGALSGQILAVEPASAKLTGLAEVIVKLPAPDLQIGTFVDGTVTMTTPEDVVVIPKDALLTTAEGHFAYVVNGDSLFRTKIEVGGKEGEVVEVTEGLYFGDRVVLQPIMPLWMAELQAIRGGKACADGH